jgi:hypothetical protein
MYMYVQELVFLSLYKCLYIYKIYKERKRRGLKPSNLVARLWLDA